MVRFTGYATGSALTTTILAAHGGGNSQPTVGGYTTVLWISAGICVVAAILAWYLPTRSTPLTPAEQPPTDERRKPEQPDGDELSS